MKKTVGIIAILLTLPSSALLTLETPVSEEEILAHYQNFPVSEITPVLDRLRQNPPRDELSKILASLQKQLNRFYSEHPERDPSFKDLELSLPPQLQKEKSWQTNYRRLFNAREIRREQNTELIREAPNLFYLHYAMAKALVLVDQPQLASHHFNSALRYRSLAYEEDLFTDPSRLSLNNNPEETADANKLLELIEATQSLKTEYRKLKEEIYNKEYTRSQNGNDPGNPGPDKDADRAKLEKKKNEITEAEQALLEHRKTIEKYRSSYNKESSTFLLDMAGLIYGIDNMIRDREMVLNQKEYYRTNYDGTFKQFWRLENRHSAYIGLLEIAARLDPTNPGTPLRLAVQYQKEGEEVLARSAYTTAIDYQKNSTPEFALSDKDLSFAHNQLGGLYYRAKRYVDAVIHYREAYQLTQDPLLRLELSRIYVEDTGNYIEALEILEQIESTDAAAGSDNPVEKGEKIKQTFTLLIYRATAQERLQAKKDLIETLNKALLLHQEIEKIISDQYQRLKEIAKELYQAKTTLHQTKNKENLQAWLDTQNRYEIQQEVIRRLETSRRGMNLQKAYFTLAEQRELIHDIAGAMETYRKAEEYGVDPDNARHQADRLRKQYHLDY